MHAYLHLSKRAFSDGFAKDVLTDLPLVWFQLPLRLVYLIHDDLVVVLCFVNNSWFFLLLRLEVFLRIGCFATTDLGRRSSFHTTAVLTLFVLIVFIILILT